MSHEIGQLDISDRQLMTKTKSKASDWTEIGEATITHSIFGKAEVHIVRKYDALRRALSRMLLFFLLAVAAWLGWVRLQPNYPAPSADLSSPLSAKDGATTPVTLTEKSAAPPSQPSVKNNAPSQATISQPAHVQKTASQMNVRPESAPLATVINQTPKLPVHSPLSPVPTAPRHAARIAASSPAATNSLDKVDATHFSADNSQ